MMFFEHLGKLIYKHNKHYWANTAALNNTTQQAGNTRQCNTYPGLVRTVTKKSFLTNQAAVHVCHIHTDEQIIYREIQCQKHD